MKDLTSLYEILRDPMFSHEERTAWLHEAAYVDDGTARTLAQELQKQRDLTRQIIEATRRQVIEAGGSPQATITLSALAQFLREHFFEGATPVLCGFLLEKLIQEGEIYDVKIFTEILADAVKNNPTLRSETPHLAVQYEETLLRAQWYRFTLLSDDDMSTLLRTQLLTLLRYQVAVRDGIDDRLDFFHDFMQLGDERKRIISVIRENEEWIGYLPLSIQGGDGEEQPTLKQWLLDYERFFSGRKVRSDIDRITYVNTAQNPKRLNEADRTFYLGVLALYDYLLFPPQIYEESRVVQPKARQPMPKAPQRPQMMQLLQETPEEKRMRDASQQRVVVAFAEQGKSHEEILYALCHQQGAPVQETQERVVALVRLLAQEGKLKDALLSQPMIALVTARLSIAHADFPVVLRFILTTVAGMSENDSARFAGQCGAWLKKAGVSGFQRMVYFDARQKIFLWS